MSDRILRVAFGLLGVMTVVSFGGPFLIGGVLRGGDSPTWPPDRPLEWAVVIGLTAVAVGVLIGLTILRMTHARQLRASNVSRESSDRAETGRGEP